MAETNARSSLLAKLSSFIVLVLLHLGCFVFSEKRRREEKDTTKTDVVSAKKRKRAIAPVVSFIKGIFSKSKPTAQTSHPPTPPRSSSQATISVASEQSPGGRSKRPSMTESEIIINDGEEDLLFPLRNDIFPCTACGEIFQKPQALESHEATRHAVSELADGDSGKNIVKIIFNSSWRSSQGTNGVNNRTPEIHRILKIHNSTKILSRFEEHREAVKSRAGGARRRRDERCAADGNEVLRFHCATFVCELGRDGGSHGVCGHQYCGVCGIIRSGFSAKLDGVSVMSTSRGAHAAVPDDVEEEFAFMNVKRAMLVCRVVAGRVGREGEDDEEEEAHHKTSGGFDSVIAGDDELLVFTPKALLPCFVIVYTV